MKKTSKIEDLKKDYTIYQNKLKKDLRIYVVSIGLLLGTVIDLYSGIIFCLILFIFIRKRNKVFNGISQKTNRSIANIKKDNRHYLQLIDIQDKLESIISKEVEHTVHIKIRVLHDINNIIVGMNKISKNQGELMISTGTLNMLNKEEVEAVLYHEAVHFINGDLIITQTASFVYESLPSISLFLISLSVFLLLNTTEAASFYSLIQMSAVTFFILFTSDMYNRSKKDLSNILHTQEFIADLESIKIGGLSKGYLIDVFNKIALVSNSDMDMDTITHPSLNKRIECLERYA